MAWNWNGKKKSVYAYKKPKSGAFGENSKELVELANSLIRKGYTRQYAYAKARAILKENYSFRPKKPYQGGKVK